MPRFANVVETIGHTPVIRLNRLAPPHVELYVKTESRNPLGSVKDRLALGIIEAAEKSGALKPGQTVVEATSGNTGIGLAMVCAQRGYPLVLVMPETFSVERRRLMRFLGAKVILTPAALRAKGMVDKTKELAEKHGWYFARQFENPANPEIHERTTAREILADFADKPLDYFVLGYGTGGTLQGVGRVLAKESPRTKIVVAEPETAQLLGSKLPQQRHPDGSPSAAHPAWAPHPVQGWTPDFIPKVTGDAVAMGLCHEVIAVSGPESIRCSQDLATQEGIFCGISSGGSLACALKVAAKAPPGSVILAVLADTGERYLSTPLFEKVPVEMTDEEQALFRSTPRGVPAA
jgi:cysteine synthase A